MFVQGACYVIHDIDSSCIIVWVSIMKSVDHPHRISQPRVQNGQCNMQSEGTSYNVHGEACTQILCIHLSPCLRLKKVAGNSWRQADPKTAVSSSALNLVELRNMFPATKLLHSYILCNSSVNTTETYCTLFLIVTWRGCLPWDASVTNSSIAAWSQKKRLPCTAGLWLVPADFFRGSPNRPSSAYTTLPPSCDGHSYNCLKYKIVR